MPMSSETNCQLNIEPTEVEHIITRLRLLQQQARRSNVSPAGKHLIEQTFNAMVVKATDLELLLDQHTEYPTRGH